MVNQGTALKRHESSAVYIYPPALYIHMQNMSMFYFYMIVGHKRHRESSGMRLIGMVFGTRFCHKAEQCRNHYS
jgi:hypothetical protein